MTQEIMSCPAYNRYVEGEELESIIQYGYPDGPLEDQTSYADWETIFKEGRLSVLTRDAYTLYVFRDEDGEPLVGVWQYP